MQTATNIQYLGEQLIWGRIGHLLIVLAFVGSLLSTFCYLYAVRTDNVSWKILARKFFALHTISIIGIFSLLFFLIINQRLEYYYVWEHSNSIMPLRYILSCFWEGQEGSFLLWMFWHSVLSWFIISRKSEWESGVMITISMVQVFLSSMLLGIVVLNYKLGSNPFILLREHSDFANLPFIQMPDYLSKIKDGRGLNPLLQNYWMTIHPPTLFLGFASTVIPFAFALAGLMRKKYTEWIQPALPYTFFGVMILGTGILMGAAWAYESLSFGGFWAWDPVENASLVPWLTLVGASHVMMIYKSRGHSLLSVYLLCITTFILILYSTFLTRSGILGNTSVHAFTDLGMSGQLLVYMLFFVALSIVLMVRARKHISIDKTDEHLTSREFWMFIGMLVLLIGTLQIIFTTSTPVINKLFGTNLAPPADPIDHYNRWQVPIAVIICLLIGIGQFFKWKQTDAKDFFRKIILSILISLAVTGVSALYLGEYRMHYYFLFFASVFAIVANISYILKMLKGNLSKSGASIAHIGIGMILLGALISNSKKEIISQNVKGFDLGKDFPNRENIMIESKIDTLPMGDYFVVYKGKEQIGINIFYTIEYFGLNKATGKKEKAFELQPVFQLNERMGNVVEPATKRFFSKDIYTHLTYAPLEEKGSDPNDIYQPEKTKSIAIGDTFITSNSFIIADALDKNIDRASLHLNDSDIAIGVHLRIEDINKKIYDAEPVFIIKDFAAYSKEAIVDSLGLRIAFNKIDPTSGKIDLVVSEKKSNKKDFIIMKAIIFPGINILWMGCIMMIIGTLIAIRQRIKIRK